MTTKGELTDKLLKYCKLNSLTPRSADDMMYEQQELENTACEHVEWLSSFIEKWDKAVDQPTAQEITTIKVCFQQLNDIADKYETGLPELLSDYT